MGRRISATFKLDFSIDDAVLWTRSRGSEGAAAPDYDMNNKLREHAGRILLHRLGIDAADAARLVLEAAEALHLSADEGRVSLMLRLRELVQAGAEALRQREQTRPFAEAARLSLEARSHRRALTLRDLRTFVRRMLRVPGVAECPLRGFDAERCRAVLQAAFGSSVHSYRKGRAILHSIFAYGRRQGWCAENPVDAIEAPPVREGEIRALAPAECERLLQAARRPAHRACLPALGLMMYAGVRPAEVARLDWQDVCWQDAVVLVRPAQSKTGGGRLVPLSGPLCRMLRRCCPASGRGPICPPQWLRRWRELRRCAGFVRWVPDVLRHTYATYHARYYGDLSALQLNMGHRSLALLQTRYLNFAGVTAAAARRFWRLQL